MVFDYPPYFDKSLDFDEETTPKLMDLKNLLNNECKEAETIILFTVYKEYQNSLVDWFNYQGYSSMVMNGDTSDEERQEIIKAFKNKQFRVLITNVQKGLNFGNCDYCIFYSFNPNPNKMVQMEGRITRSFDIINKHVYLLCSKGEEFRTLNNVIKRRAKASSEFSTADLSCIMGLLLQD
jgi:ERCC4-related helicase